jgi:hypothetical protein
MRSRNIRNSLLSALVIISWVVILLRIFNAVRTDQEISYILISYFLMLGIGSLGGILLLFFNALKPRKLKYLFVFNLFATCNLLIGSFGLATFFQPGHNPYFAAGSISVGILMYKAIYS